jgi:hypothetical protein
MLARQLTEFDVVNIGAAGTFVIRGRVSRARVRAAFSRALPFATAITICDGRDITRLLSRDPFSNRRGQPGLPNVRTSEPPACRTSERQAFRTSDVLFVSVLHKRRRAQTLPIDLPSTGRWLVRILGREGPFVFGMYRREMKVIGYLGKLDQLFGVPVTTRNWNTIAAIGKVLEKAAR